MYDTYEQFDDTLAAVFSSGCGFDMSMSNWQKRKISELVEGMDRDSVVEHLNLFYGSQDPSDLLEGELSYMAECVSNLDVNRDKVKVESRITFS